MNKLRKISIAFDAYIRLYQYTDVTTVEKTNLVNSPNLENNFDFSFLLLDLLNRYGANKRHVYDSFRSPDR